MRASNDSKLVFVGEDDEQLRAVLRETFLDAGFSVEDYASGKALVAAFQVRLERNESLPVLVVTDLFMEDENGLEVISRLRRFDRLTRLVLMSGVVRDKTRLAAEAMNASFLAKPFTPEALWRVAFGTPGRDGVTVT